MSLDPTTMLFAAVLKAQRAAPARALMLDVAPDIAAASGIPPSSWTAVESWKPRFDALRAAGFDTHPVLPPDDGTFDLALVRLGRQRARNLARIAQAVRRVSEAGLVVIAGENEIGAAAYGKPLGRPPSLSKHHARAFWFTADAAPPRSLRDGWEDAVRPRPQGADGHIAAPGLFAWDRIDAGSALLAAALPADLAGVVADLGSGWGFLAREIVARCPAVSRVGVVRGGLARARRGTRQSRDGARRLPLARRHARSAARELRCGRHQSAVPCDAPRRSTIGQRVIRNAASALRAGGALWLVANRHLPYETTLRECFAQVETRVEADGYKVILARGPRRQNVPG